MSRFWVFVVAVCLALNVWAQTVPPSTEQKPLAEQPSSDVKVPAQSASTVPPWDKNKEFSALVVGTLVVKGSGEPLHIYRSGNLMRMEGADKHSYIVQNLTKKADARAMSRLPCFQLGTSYIRSFPFSMTAEASKIDVVEVGKDTFDGHPSQVVDVTVTFPIKARQPLHFKLWLADDLQGFPVKLETVPPNNRRPPHTIEFSNVVLGPQDPTLFIVPDTCGGLDKDAKKSSSQPNSAPFKKSK